MEELTRSVFVEVKPYKSISEANKSILSLIVGNLPKWMQEEVEYKKTGILTEDEYEARKLKLAAKRYYLVNESCIRSHTTYRS